MAFQDTRAQGNCTEAGIIAQGMVRQSDHRIREGFLSRQAAWEYYTRAIRERLDQSVAAGIELSDDDAMELAVDEVQAARRERRRA